MPDAWSTEKTQKLYGYQALCLSIFPALICVLSWGTRLQYSQNLQAWTRCQERLSIVPFSGPSQHEAPLCSLLIQTSYLASLWFSCTKKCCQIGLGRHIGWAIQEGAPFLLASLVFDDCLGSKLKKCDFRFVLAVEPNAFANFCISGHLRGTNKDVINLLTFTSVWNQ